MIAATLLLLAAGAPAEIWRCRNQVEVWCAADGCAAAPEAETTPMDVTADPEGPVSVCAYTGCWEGADPPVQRAGRVLWTLDGAAFSSQPNGAGVEITLLIIEKEGVGFVRAGGLATPLLCERAARVSDR